MPATVRIRPFRLADYGEVRRLWLGTEGIGLNESDTREAAGRYLRRNPGLSLETGSQDYFRPAHALYQSHGFAECPPFATYLPDPNSRFFSLDLAQS